LLTVVGLLALPGGHVAALIDVQDPFGEPLGPTRFPREFVQEVGRWLIDEQIMLEPVAPDQVGTPTASSPPATMQCMVRPLDRMA
jgi:hypothetical protein